MKASNTDIRFLLHSIEVARAISTDFTLLFHMVPRRGIEPLLKD
jgi:hypothetical protein